MATISVIVPFLNEAENIPGLYQRLCEVAGGLQAGDEMEVLMVDDGSSDGSARVVRSLPVANVRVSLVRLSRNFGSHAALAAGVAHAKGDVLTFISADLQDPPELILDFMQRWRSGFEIVWGVREAREDPPLSKLFSHLYYSLLRKFALPTMPQGGVDVCLVDRKVVESLGNLQERNSNIFNLLMWAGYEQCFVPYKRAARGAGHSKWSMSKKIKLFVDSFVAFSFFPMRLISALGTVVSVLGLLYAALIVVRQMLFGIAVPGWSSLMVIVLLCSGTQMLILGVLSEYLWRALDAARNRPTYIVRDVESCGGERPVVMPGTSPA